MEAKGGPATRKWSIQKLEFDVRWEQEPSRAGTHVRILHDASRGEMVIRSVDFDRLGTLVPAFSGKQAGVLVAAVASAPDRIAAEYLGPFDLTRN